MAVGFAIGVSGAIALAHFVESLLFGVKPLDGIVMLSSGAILAVVALAACSVPATRINRGSFEHRVASRPGPFGKRRLRAAQA